MWKYIVILMLSSCLGKRSEQNRQPSTTPNPVVQPVAPDSNPKPTPTSPPTSAPNVTATPAPVGSPSPNSTTPSPGKSPAPTLGPITSESYDNFIGLKSGDTIDDAKKIYKSPLFIEKNPFAHFPFETAFFSSSFSISYLKSNGKIFCINVDLDDINLLRSRNTDTRAFDFLTKTKDDVLTALGPAKPEMQNGGPQPSEGILEYYSTSKNISVEFVCHEFWNFGCRRITVYWYQNRN